MANVADFIGLTWSLRKYNCWDHVAAIRKAHSLETKLFKVKNLREAYKEIENGMQSVESGMTKVDSPRDFDVVITHKQEDDIIKYHCGMYYQGGVSHCGRDIGSIHQPYNEFIEDAEGVTFWR